jgi:hypothetical protein
MCSHHATSPVRHLRDGVTLQKSENRNPTKVLLESRILAKFQTYSQPRPFHSALPSKLTAYQQNFKQNLWFWPAPNGQEP